MYSFQSAIPIRALGNQMFPGCEAGGPMKRLNADESLEQQTV